MMSSFPRKGLGGIVGKILHRNGCQAMDQVVQGSGGVTIPEST